MGIGVKDKISRFISRFDFSLPSRSDRFEDGCFKLNRLMDELQNLKSSYNDSCVTIVNISNSLEKNLKKEIRLRKTQSTKLLDRIKSCEDYENVSYSKFNTIDESLKKATTKVDNIYELLDTLKRELGVFHGMKDKYENLDTLSSKVKIEYDNYIKQMIDYHEEHLKRLHGVIESYKKEISEFKKSDNAVSRLSTLEERITLLEIENKKLTEGKSIVPIKRPPK